MRKEKEKCKIFITIWTQKKVPASHSNIFLFKRHQKVRQRAKDAASRGKVPMSPDSPPRESSHSSSSLWPCPVPSALTSEVPEPLTGDIYKGLILMGNEKLRMLKKILCLTPLIRKNWGILNCHLLSLWPYGIHFTYGFINKISTLLIIPTGDSAL